MGAARRILGEYKISMVSLISVLLWLQITTAEFSTAPQWEAGPNFEILDKEGKYMLEWTVDWSRREIVFNATVQAKGYIALGLSAKGDYAGADIVIGGVSSDGRSYFTDRYGIREEESIIDASQDWTLITAMENNSHTFLSFSRAFDTCDDMDYPVNEFDLVTLLWEYGDYDNPRAFHSGTRGQYSVYLLDPNLAPRSLKEQSFYPGPPPQSILDSNALKLWAVTSRVQLPPQETYYHCSIHRGADIRQKHHIVGFNTRFEPEQERSRSHHMLMFRCAAPPNSTAEEIFERFVDHPGEECYILSQHNGQIPTQYCFLIKYAYGTGARMAWVPETAGLAIGDTGEQEYFLLQTHYDNPERRDIELTINVDLYYTSNLRPTDGGIMTVGHHVPASPSILLPPDTEGHSIYGHCSSECTTEMFPAEGIKVSAISLHTHLSGRSIKVRQFRKGRELPWILADENFDFNFQIVRTLNTERTVLPGDQITIHCGYDTKWTNGSSVVGGYSTRQEMCIIFMFHHTVLPAYPLCRSEILSEGYMRRYLGVSNITWDNSKRDIVATAPPSLTGMNLTEISNGVNWTPQLRAELLRDHRRHPQNGVCTSILSSVPGLVNSQASQQAHTVILPEGRVDYSPPARQCPN